ncbi:MAG TPA: PHP domain-containing protein [Lachnospiraceae bacterium]|nr:PHP domain-containing protein [Lachnospiraceae bacterium]
MDEKINRQITQLNADNCEDRLNALRQLRKWIDDGTIPAVKQNHECNNHVHSRYSFSPYSPSGIAWKAYQTGLSTCGLMDHESVAGAAEFREACHIMGIAPTIGFEVRLNWDDTPLRGQKFNNPDQLSVGYFPVHGVPTTSLEAVEAYLKPIRRARERRNRQMTGRVDEILRPFGMELDFDRHVIPVSWWREKGSITERHILYAAGRQMTKRYGRGSGLLRFLQEDLGIPVTDKVAGYLTDGKNPCYDFDLTNLLKGYFSEKMYIPANHEEAPDVREAIPYIQSLGCIPTYTYVGDVTGESVTGDKKVQRFEDGILDDLFFCLDQYDVRAFSYAPARNTPEQLARVQRLCAKYNMLEVLGEDINQPRQPFINTALGAEEKKRFDTATWAVIGHEKAAARELSEGMFGAGAVERFPDIADRAAHFAALGHK